MTVEGRTSRWTIQSEQSAASLARQAREMPFDGDGESFAGEMLVC